MITTVDDYEENNKQTRASLKWCNVDASALYEKSVHSINQF